MIPRSETPLGSALPDDLVIIDWISTPFHRSFNRSFFRVSRISPYSQFYVFDRELVDEHPRTTYSPPQIGRLARLQQVLRLCWLHRDKPILLLTYDPLCLPAVLALKGRVAVFEHNTVPENGLLSKHGVWQACLYRRCLRLAQYPEQANVLRRLRSRTAYVGSPLRINTIHNRHPQIDALLTPSHRLHADELIRIAPSIGHRSLIVKRSALSDSARLSLSSYYRLEEVEQIDMDRHLAPSRGVLISVVSAVRGSGWFNESIGRGVPLIISDPGARALFRETFPEYPFVNPDEIARPDNLDAALNDLRAFDFSDYIARHTQLFYSRLSDAFTDFLTPTGAHDRS
jgi:hypothetical protein